MGSTPLHIRCDDGISLTFFSYQNNVLSGFVLERILEI